MNWNEIARWANANQGVLDLLAIIVAGPALLVLLYQGARRLWPGGRVRRLRAASEFEHAEKLKREIEAHAAWQSNEGYYGEFLLRDTERRLPNSEEKHSAIETPHTVAVLTKIHSEHLEFTTGSLGRRYIKQIAGSWYFADKEDEGAVLVDAVFWLNCRDIEMVRWETDEYWEWPQVCCRFSSRRKFPFSRLFYASEERGLPRPFYREVCLLSDVMTMPEALRK